MTTENTTDTLKATVPNTVQNTYEEDEIMDQNQCAQADPSGVEISGSSKNFFTVAMKYIKKILPVFFWLLVWQVASDLLHQEILLVSPITAVTTLLRLMGISSFYQAVLVSFGHILLGFALALITGTLLAVAAFRISFVQSLLQPFMATIKATPVASIVILALVWLNSRNLSIFTGFLMVLPVMYANTLAGLNSTSPKLLQMAHAFSLRPFKTIQHIYIPACLPYFLTGCRLSLGICWKAGIAAEVIGQPAGSIGDKLYRAKLFLSTDELFAWTLAIILLSVLFEKLVLLAMERLSGVYHRKGAL